MRQKPTDLCIQRSPIPIGYQVAIDLWLASLCLICGCSQDEGTRPPLAEATAIREGEVEPAISPIRSEFIGSASCTECHADVAQEYQSHSMSRSLALIDRAQPVEKTEQTSFSTSPGLTYYVERDGEHAWHHEKRCDAAGEVIYDQRMSAEIVVGSGVRGRTYLINNGGRLFASPISWYTQGQFWGLSPGYSPESHPRFQRRIMHSCISCHAGKANPHPTDQDRYAHPIFLEESIGCERCHGAGKSHVSFHRDKPESSSGPDPIVNPAAFADARRDAVCNQCHLLGERRILRSGRTEFDFQPGMHLSDVWTYLLRSQDTTSGTADAVSQVEQMHASVCFRESQGALSCISCHDPHRRPPAGEVELFYRARCLKCHSSEPSQCSEDPSVRLQQSASDSCIQCHMPKFEAGDIHAAQTNHRMVRQPDIQPNGPTDDSSTKPFRLVVFEESGIRIPSSESNRAFAIYLSEQASKIGDLPSANKAVQLIIPGLKVAPDDVDAYFALGQALHQLGRNDEAAIALQKILERQPRNELALEAIAKACQDSGNLTLAKEYYGRLLDVNPATARYYERFADVLGRLGESSAAVKAIESALELDPSRMELHALLTEAYKQSGDAAKAEYHANKYQAFGGADRQ